MTKPVEPLSDFDDLRRVGIAYAQDASGEIWTDFNIHDPGVTLLEQTCFALSQIAYQVSLPTRDLLTNARGHFCAQDLALFKPRKVLATDPVTRDDLAAWLCACPQIDSVTIAPLNSRRAGFYDVTIVPATRDTSVAAAESAFRDAFAQARPLCTDLGQVDIARPVDVMLHGRVEIGAEALPETAAAALYHQIRRLLTGAHAAERAATRADVWDAPERLLPTAKNRSAQTLDLNRYLARLRKLPGVHDIGALSLTPLTIRPKEASDASYFHLLLPRADAEIGITLTLNGAPVTLSAARLREEFIRISAENIGEATHHIDRIDWDVMKPGRHRRFLQSHVDALLPALYRMPYSDAVSGDAAALFAQYRDAIDTQLRDMVDSLSALPSTFTADPQRMCDDPVQHRMRVDLLDYLIALQGAAMPATRHSGLHRYMSTRARHRFEIAWRLEYLFALPALHRARGTGPSDHTPGGFLAELAILCDLEVSRSGVLSMPSQDYALAIDREALFPTDAAERPTIISAHNPFDMLVPFDDTAAPFDRDALHGLSDFFEQTTLSPAMLARLTDTDCFCIAPHTAGRWLILLDPGASGPVQQIAVAENKSEAQNSVNRLRATWRHINRGLEVAHLVEHVRLSATGGKEAHVADLILPGYTARCSMESYRSYVETCVENIAPAHLHVRVHWVDPNQRAAFVHVAQAAETGAEPDRDALRCHLDALAVEGAY
ncbi:MAG: hypothetical protein AB8B62_05325 [Roseobacter sp.]